jgi:hypothetical protein
LEKKLKSPLMTDSSDVQSPRERIAYRETKGITQKKHRRVLPVTAQVSSDDVFFDEKRFRTYQTGLWAEKYNELCQYRQQNGHCLVPRAYQENPALARWVKRQRYQYQPHTGRE